MHRPQMNRFIKLTTLMLFIALMAAPLAYADSQLKVGPDKRVRVYKLETVEIRGSTRLTAKQLSNEFGLKKDLPLNDEVVMTTRAKLLSLGLFKSAILIMRKGSRPGYARLIIDVEDDDGVLSDWAIGGELGHTISEQSASQIPSDHTPRDYRVGLIGRNILGNLHRASILVDFDSEGQYSQGQIAYGLPRFAKEDTQFDAEIASVNVSKKYLDVLGFGGRGQGLWSESVDDLGEYQYGAAMYINKEPHFAVPGFPKVVAGPKIAYIRETRFLGFYPRPGYLIATSLLLSPITTEDSVIEINLGKTMAIKTESLFWTLQSDLLSVGNQGYSLRAESRFDIPLNRAHKNADQAELFIRFRNGIDRFDQTNLFGSAAIIGVRYHSSGFIAELAVKVTRSPGEFIKDKPLANAEGGL